METNETNEQLITKFYTAFAAKDFRTMAECYHPNIEFEDPAFGKLKEAEVAKMWEMLLTRSKDLSLTFSDVIASSKAGNAKWIAHYTFSATGRMVVNAIQASFEFNEGKISKHSDSFNLNKWFVMAFGAKGYLFIIFPFLRSTFKKKVKKTLDSFMTR
jgi:ketosteroid isomerase-like protein